MCVVHRFCIYPLLLWELACLRWRPVSRPVFPECTHSKCGSEPAREAVDLAVAVAVALAFDLDLPPLFQRPNAGVAQGAPRQGCRGSRPRPWMADGGGPPEQCRREGMPSLSEAPNGGAKPLVPFSAFGKGTRCKSETASGRDRRNGYVHPQKSPSTIRPPSRASLAPTKGKGQQPPAGTTAETDMYTIKASIKAFNEQ